MNLNWNKVIKNYLLNIYKIYNWKNNTNNNELKINGNNKIIIKKSVVIK